MPLLERIVIATSNPGKLEEYRRLLEGLVSEILSASDVGSPEIVEDAPSLEGNALKKARVLFELTGIPALGDDTGLEVEALGGRPGVYSARYAGPDCTPKDNVVKLLGELQGSDHRAASFRTAVAFIDVTGERVFEGVCSGDIVREPRGRGGFGYDPVFLPKDEVLTFAQLPAARKNLISHRGRALQALVRYLDS